MEHKPNLGISTCLLGEKVRYDGQQKLNLYLRDQLGAFVEYIPVCSEVECGLPIPREAVRLIGDPENPRLLTNKTGIDHTERMVTWAEGKLAQLEKENLCGFIFKSKSPSSGMRDIRIYNEKGYPVAKGTGMFAKIFMERFPLMPVEDEGRLNDARLRENFIEHIFVYQRWQTFQKNNPTIKGLINFHTDHKLLIMAHSPKHLRELGTFVAQTEKIAPSTLFEQYFTLLMVTLRMPATIKKNVNVLHHVMGYFKKQLTSDEKQELLEIIDNYHKGLIPLIAPIVLLRYFTRKYKEAYLNRQYYLNPHPIELMLRNHV